LHPRGVDRKLDASGKGIPGLSASLRSESCIELGRRKGAGGAGKVEVGGSGGKFIERGRGGRVEGALQRETSPCRLLKRGCSLDGLVLNLEIEGCS